VVPSMPRDMARRYVEALWYSVHTEDADFAASASFAEWWARHGWVVHRSVADGWANWYAQSFPHSDDNRGRAVSYTNPFTLLAAARNAGARSSSICGMTTAS
jgi:hypothetical protein